MAEPGAKLAQDERGELLEHVGREQVPVGAGELLQLSSDSGVHLAVCVTTAESRRSARAVQVPPAIGIKQVTALAANDVRQVTQSKTDWALCAQEIVCIGRVCSASY